MVDNGMLPPTEVKLGPSAPKKWKVNLTMDGNVIGQMDAIDIDMDPSPPKCLESDS
jgi:hypothetical protein